MKNLLLVVVTLLLATGSYAQAPITIAELTITVAPASEESVYYGLEAGDELSALLLILDGKEVSRFTITEYPDYLRVSEAEIRREMHQRLRIERRGIYRFSLHNDHPRRTLRVKLLLQRQPASAATVAFNAAVRWQERLDTVYTGAGTQEVVRPRRSVVRTDTSVITLLDRAEVVHSRGNITNDNVTSIAFRLPRTTSTDDQTTETLAWAYWIGTGEGSQSSFNAATATGLAKLGAKGAIATGLISSGYGALVLLALEGVSYFTQPSSGDNVRYELVEQRGDKTYSVEHGNSITGFGRQDRRLSGAFSLQLENDNYVESIVVNVKVIAIQLTKTYQTVQVHETVPAFTVQRQLVPVLVGLQ